MSALSFLDRERSVAGPGYSRWLVPPAALAIHLCIGQVYAFSVFKTSLVAHFDAGLTPIAWIFSIAIVMLGLSAAAHAPPPVPLDRTAPVGARRPGRGGCAP